MSTTLTIHELNSIFGKTSAAKEVLSLTESTHRPKFVMKQAKQLFGFDNIIEDTELNIMYGVYEGYRGPTLIYDITAGCYLMETLEQYSAEITPPLFETKPAPGDLFTADGIDFYDPTISESTPVVQTKALEDAVGAVEGYWRSQGQPQRVWLREGEGTPVELVPSDSGRYIKPETRSPKKESKMPTRRRRRRRRVRESRTMKPTFGRTKPLKEETESIDDLREMAISQLADLFDKAAKVLRQDGSPASLASIVDLVTGNAQKTLELFGAGGIEPTPEEPDMDDLDTEMPELPDMDAEEMGDPTPDDLDDLDKPGDAPDDTNEDINDISAKTKATDFKEAQSVDEVFTSLKAIGGDDLNDAEVRTLAQKYFDSKNE